MFNIFPALFAIEFQKRGLPHAHILLFVHEEDIPKMTTDMDKVVSAEFPDRESDPITYISVCQLMIHGPCVIMNHNCQCMIKGKCSKHNPIKVNYETTIDKHGFPKRNSDNFVTTSSGVNLDNCRVIPHNASLVVKYQAHINVEICYRAKSIKYLFKYINKGHDRAAVIEENNVTNQNFVREVDVKTYIDYHYIFDSEASWRIF